MEYQTRIVFDNHQMLLRFKLRDTDDKKYHYITHSDYVPPMEGADSELKSSIQIPQGTIATPVISPSISDKANRSFFMTGMTTQRTQDSFRNQIMEFIKPEDKAFIEEIKLKKKNTAIVFCKSWEDCSRIVMSRKGTKFQEEKVYLSMFYEKKPT